MALYPQCLADVAGGNGGAFAWGILNSFRMKPLSGQPAATRKPWTRFYGITAGESGLQPFENGHVNTDTEDSIKQRLITALFQFRFD